MDIDISEMRNLREVKYGKGDLLICNYCKFKGLMPFYTEACPNCGKVGYLAFQGENKKEDIGDVYIPIKDC